MPIFKILDFYFPKIQIIFMIVKVFTSGLDKSLIGFNVRINAQIAKSMVHRLIHVWGIWINLYQFTKNVIWNLNSNLG